VGRVENSGKDFQSWRDPSNDSVVREMALDILDNPAARDPTVLAGRPSSWSGR
jgi:hypothetical protein